MHKFYARGKQIGEGTYARIYIGTMLESVNIQPKIVPKTDTSIGTTVALKRIKKNVSIKGIDLSTVREIKALKICRNDFIVDLIDVFRYDGDIYLAMEYLPVTLEDIIKNEKIIFLPSDIKTWMAMLIKGLKAIHDMFMVHRDLKPSNILVKDGVLKIADFGLCRSIDSEKMTCQAFTRWYRPPELLLGCSIYGTSADMWSLGCIMGEMAIRRPLFFANSDIAQLTEIFKVLGTPDDSYFESIVTNMSIMFKKCVRSNIEDKFIAAGVHAKDVIISLLDFDPSKRLNCKQLMNHIYFKTAPFANPPAEIAKYDLKIIEEKV